MLETARLLRDVQRAIEFLEDEGELPSASQPVVGSGVEGEDESDDQEEQEQKEEGGEEGKEGNWSRAVSRSLGTSCGAWR